MRPDQLTEYRRPSDARLHPDGVRIAFVVTQMDLDEDRYVRRIWLWDGTGARPLTAGPADTTPRWSPDGSTLAFLRKGADKKAKPQVALLPSDGGEAMVLTDFALGASELDWAPDGLKLAVVAHAWLDAADADLDDDERERRPRRITRLPYRGDNIGWRHDRRRHVFLVDPADGSDPVCLTPGEFDEFAIAWHPDGSEIACVSARHEERGLDAGGQVWRVPIDGGAPVAATGVGLWGQPTYDTEGALHAIGTPDRWNMPSVRLLYGLGGDTPRARYAHLDRNLEKFSPPVSPAGPQWLPDGSALSTLEDSGRIRVIRLLPDDTTEDVVGGDRLITGVDPRPDGRAFAFTATSPTDPGELWWWEDGTETKLTALNADFRATTPLTEPERFDFEIDGVTIEGWVYLRAGDDRVPLLLNIHGGPATQYGYGFFDEFQVYAGAGYGVVAINPRGSSGYGEAHVKAVVGRWNEAMPPDMADFFKAIDVAEARFPRLDNERLGVMGGSYGGLATARLLGMDQRFRSAVAERGLYSWPSFHGTSDIGPWFTKMYLGEDMTGDAGLVWDASPLAYAKGIATPTLIVHSQSDFRTPIEQGEQLFVLLLQRGVETELLRFPDGEGHELSRSGSPKHRVERFEAILDWHARHLT